MNREQFFAIFEQMKGEPDAVKALRSFIINLAVRGELVAQDTTDEPASVLFNQISTERKGRIARGEMKKSTHPETVKEMTFELPLGWEWIPLGMTGNIFSGNSVNATNKDKFSKVKQGFPFIATKDVGYGLDEIKYDSGLMIPASENIFKTARPKSVFICSEGGSAGKRLVYQTKKFVLEINY